MAELWQLYNEQGNPIAGEGGSKGDVYKMGLLHGASHVWIWRKKGARAEVLVQKRSASKRTWPRRYDISAAGHIDLGETPLNAAVRETKEEIGLPISQKDLTLISLHRAYMVTDSGDIENEFQWLYLLELAEDKNFILEESEVGSLEWKTLQDFETGSESNNYVPHGTLYYQTVAQAIAFEQ